MKKLLLAAFLISTIISCKQKDSRNPKNETEENIYRSADSMTNAFKTKDWTTFVKFSHPNMIKMVGGMELFQRMLQESMAPIPDTAIKEIGVEKILQVVKTDKDIQCVVEQNLLMQLQGTQVASTTYLVGESLNAGKTWTFFDASNSGNIDPKVIMPNLSPEIKVPAKKQETKQL